jgi:hypothetical protein
MIGPWEFVVIALAAFRMTHFFVYDSLIGANLESESKFATKLDRFSYNTEDGSDRSWARGKIGDLLNCPWCLGFWISAGLWAVWVWGPEWARYGQFPWAIAGVQASVEMAVRRLTA